MARKAKADSKLLKKKKTIPKPGSVSKRKSKILKKAANGARESQTFTGPNKSHTTYYKPRKEWDKDLREDTRYKNQAASKRRKKTTTRKKTTAKAPPLSSIKSTAGAVKYLKGKGYTVSKRKKK